MYIFKKTTTIKSKVCPGVEIIVRKMTESRRIELQMAIVEPNEKIRELLTKISAMKAEDTTSERNTPVILKINDEVQRIITKELNPLKIRWGVAAIKGLALGDENDIATLDNLLEWPSDLVEEVLNIVEQGSGMSEKESKNSASPTISGDQMETRPDSTTATPADGTSAS